MTANHDRLLELLTDRALVGLGAREQIELAELLVQAQDIDAAVFDKAASAIALASVAGKVDAMPDSLLATLEEQAIAAMASSQSLRPVSDYSKTRQAANLTPGFVQTHLDQIYEPASHEVEDIQSNDFKHTQVMGSSPPPAARPIMSAPAPMAAPVYPQQHSSQRPPQASYAPPPQASYAPPPQISYAPPPSNVVPLSAARKPSNVVAIAGWIAAAACFLLAIGAIAMMRKQAGGGTGPVATNVIPPPPPAVPEITPPIPKAPETAAQLHDKLLALAGTVRTEWAATKDPGGKGAGGEVVWNKEQQRGTMTFRGLAKNDPSRIQYQLWIFDKTRDDKYPVDGGVFDIDATSGDVVVPIRAAIPVTTATLFAITIEKPGGVVVSKREHLVLVAKLPAG